MTENEDLRRAAAGIMTMGVSVTDVVTRLAKATPSHEIKQRPGPHSKFCEKPCRVQHEPLDYVDARFVMDVLDDAVGPDNWQRQHVMGDGGKVICSIGIRIDGEWIWKADGAGETDIEGEKGSFSDSFKRAGVSWGIARDLYDKDRPRTAPSAPLRTVPRYDDQPIEESRGSYRARVPDDIADDGKCPKHDRPWRNGRYGGYCTAKDDSGPKGYCTLKAPEDWQPPA